MNEGHRTSYTDGEEAVRRMEMEDNLPKAMFQKAETLAMIFTTPSELTFEEHECYRSNVEDGGLEGGLGMSFTEYCENDILKNMIAWTADGNSIFYMTHNFTYIFTLNEHASLIEISQFEKGRWIRNDSWLNPHSVGVGKEFLKNYPDKQIPLFVEG